MSGPDAPIRIGYIPLLDAAPVLVAARKGFAAAEGLDLALVRETSWATIRDRLAVGHLDAAHILAPMPIAANLGLTPMPSPMVVPMTLGIGGNTVTVSRALWQSLAAQGARPDFDPAAAAAALAAEVRARRSAGGATLTFGIVHAFSTHHYALAYWLAHAGIQPGRDVELTVLPPSLMEAALAGGHIDGFCAGEPWGSLAAEGGAAILTTGAHIWRTSPEKVLGVRAAWAESNPDALARLLRAVCRAAAWCDAAENRAELAALLAEPAAVNRPAAVIGRSLARRLPTPDGGERAVADFLTFADKAATFPWLSHALWLYTQMVRWGQAEHSPANLALARRTYRPALYRAALAGLDLPVPAANAKVEGMLDRATPVGSPSGTLWLGPDGFFDGRVFDPDRIDAYIAAVSDPI
ncbi:MAG: ABC transporter substrate-binding protein [Alphaproteobacteria bacterium]|nr:ABC transporter substrate-binding protein [Alphaproteobacteria bacterium]